ncbi:unnamed protein product, partial [Didymodactylos carnosus]
ICSKRSRRLNVELEAIVEVDDAGLSVPPPPADCRNLSTVCKQQAKKLYILERLQYVEK